MTAILIFHLFIFRTCIKEITPKCEQAKACSHIINQLSFNYLTNYNLDKNQSYFKVLSRVEKEKNKRKIHFVEAYKIASNEVVVNVKTDKDRFEIKLNVN